MLRRTGAAPPRSHVHHRACGSPRRPFRGGEQRADRGEPVDDRPPGGEPGPGVDEGHRRHRDAGVQLGLGGHLDPGGRCGDEGEADANVAARDHRELLDVQRMLNGDLLGPARRIRSDQLGRRRRPSRNPARAARPTRGRRSRRALEALRQIVAEGLDRVAQRGAAQEGDRREVGSERPRHEAELHGTEALVAVDGQNAELGQRRPHPLALGIAGDERLLGHRPSRVSSVSIDSLSQRCSSVSSRSMPLRDRRAAAANPSGHRRPTQAPSQHAACHPRSTSTRSSNRPDRSAASRRLCVRNDRTSACSASSRSVDRCGMN